MKATLISKENGEAKLTMDFTAEEFDKAIVHAYQQNKDKFPVDGFRKGKAPRSIIEKRYGENVFTEDAINSLFSSEYPAAIDELDLRVIDAPRVEFSEIKKGQPLTTTITVAVYPDVEVKDYLGVEIEREDAEVTDEDLEKEMQMLRERNARIVTVDKKAESGDTVLLDYKGFVGDKQFEGGTAEGYALKLGSGSFIPGFEEQLIGAEKDEERDVKVTFPENYHADDLAGKEAVFKCKIHEVKEEQLPDLDDEFAKDTSEYDTLDEMKKSVRDDLVERKKNQAENIMKDRVLKQVYDNNDIDVPDVMVEDEIDQMINETNQQLQMQGLDLSKYLSALGQDMAKFRSEIKEEAHRRVKSRMIVEAVAEAEGLKATEEEVSEELSRIAEMYQMEADTVRQMLGGRMDMIESDISIKKAIQKMFDEAVQTEPKEKPADDGEAKEENDEK